MWDPDALIGRSSKVRRGVRTRCANLGTLRWLLISIGLSVALTVLLNVGLRAFPGAGRRVAQQLAKLTSPNVDDFRRSDRRVRVFTPWKAMIVGSLILTIVVNLMVWII